MGFVLVNKKQLAAIIITLSLLGCSSKPLSEYKIERNESFVIKPVDTGVVILALNRRKAQALRKQMDYQRSQDRTDVMIKQFQNNVSSIFNGKRPHTNCRSEESGVGIVCDTIEY